MDKKSQESRDRYQLLERIAHGDRDALQDLIRQYESRLRRRIRGKIASCRSSIIDDTDDIFMSACRRLDEALATGRISSDTFESLERYIFGVAVRVTQEVVRREFRRHKLAANLPDERSRERSSSRRKNAVDAVQSVLGDLRQDDQLLLMLLARLESHKAAARALGISLDAYRKRWLRIRHRVQTMIEADDQLWD